MAKVDPLYVAQLVIYAILIQPALFCLIKHGRHGILGWLYLQLFCTVRIVGAALIIHQKSSTGLAALIVGSFGLSPLLLCAAGILHESRTYRNPRNNRRFAWFLTFHFHTLISVALVMVIISVVKLDQHKTTHATSIMLKIGLTLIILAWVLLVIWTVLSWRSRSVNKLAPGYLDGTRLLNGVALGLPLILVRLLYAAISLSLDLSNPGAGFTTSRTAKILMSVIPEMLFTAGLLSVGVRTRDIKRLYTRVDVNSGNANGSGMERGETGVQMHLVK